MTTDRRSFLTAAGSALAFGATGNAAASADVTGAATSGQAKAPPAEDLCYTSARELARLLQSGQLSAREVMAAHLKQIAHWNPTVNAIVAKLDDDRCMALADAADRQRKVRGPLHGLPIAIKDTEPAVGFPFTRGSPIFRNEMPAEDSVIVERMRSAGAIFIGKTNVPEFGMGSHTYNKVYGTTLNPYDTRRTAGGSSGGAAVALATGMLPIVNGSDLGGSLRNPGNFNNVVGFRPTMGLVPAAPATEPFGNMGVKGPLARTVGDVALLMSVMAGADANDPASYPSDPQIFSKPLEHETKGIRVAWCPDLGSLPLEPEVRTVLDAQRATLERLGCIVEDAHPDLTGADEAFLTLRAWHSWSNLGALLERHRGEMKQEAITEIENGAKFSGSDIARAMTLQTQVMASMRNFQRNYDYVLCAVNQVQPFDARISWPHEIAGTTMEHYIAWMKSAYWITVTGCPAISVPAGFTTDGLPVGLQIVGRYRADFELLQFAHMFEQATHVGRRRPELRTAS